MHLKPFLIKVATRHATTTFTACYPSAALAIESSMQRFPDSRKFSAKPVTG